MAIDSPYQGIKGANTYGGSDSWDDYDNSNTMGGRAPKSIPEARSMREPARSAPEKLSTPKEPKRPLKSMIEY